MNINNENRPGYKNSKVGWIPEGWDGLLWGQLLSLTSGKTRPQDTSNNKSLLPVFGGNGVMGYSTSSNNDGENLMIGRVGEKCGCVHRHSGKCWITDNALFVTEYKRKADIPFLFYSLSHLKLNRFKKEAGQPLVSQQLIYDLGTGLPPLPEQRAIAAVLECWDRGIRNLELKIEKKRNVKKGLMQRLLSGKQRLKGFSEVWKRVRLGDVFEFMSSYAFSRECLTTEAIDNSDIYNIHYGDIHATYTGPILDLAKERRVPMLKTSDALPDTLKFLQEGDLVMADVSEDYEGIGACIELKNLAKKKLTGGLHTFVMRDESGHTASGFRGYMFKEYRLAKELKRIATGVSVYSLSKTNLSEVELTLPPLAEQMAIADVLCAADTEIEALEKKLSLWKEQKKYLLNNLVTGTIRLPQFCLKQSSTKNLKHCS